MSLIYAIFEQSTQTPIYVGSTTSTLCRRFTVHLQDCYRHNSTSQLHIHMREVAPTMQDARDEFYIQQLKQCNDELAPEYEDFYTNKLRNDGYSLLNEIKPGKLNQPIDARTVPAYVDEHTLFCRMCAKQKPRDEFHNKKSATGKQSYCAECQIELMTQYRRDRIFKAIKKLPSQYTSKTFPLSKYCKKCNRVLSIDKFYVCATHKDGFQSYCSNCCKKYDKQKRASKSVV